MYELVWLLPAFIMTFAVIWVVRSDRKRNRK